MAKEMNVNCDFLENKLVCKLLEHTMDVLLKVRTKTGEHTFREDIYTHMLKYRKWNNELRPFRSLKRRVANIFQKRDSLSDDSRGTSTQTIINHVEREEVRSETSSERRDSVHSDWSELIPVNRKVEYKRLYDNTNESTGVARATTSAADDAETILKLSAPPAKKTIKI